MKLSQNDTILNHLMAGGTLSRLEALFSFRIQNVTARICDLRDHGIDVQTRIKRDPQGAEYAEYYMDYEHQVNTLRQGRAYRHNGVYRVA